MKIMRDGNTKTTIKAVCSTFDEVVGYTDIATISESPYTVRYTSGDLVYVEGMEGTQYCSRYWSADSRINLPAESFATPSFQITVNDKTLKDWSFVLACELENTSKNARHHCVKLQSCDMAVSVTLHTLLDGTSVLVRYIEVINEGEHPIALDKLAPFTPKLWTVNQSGSGQFLLGSFVKKTWTNEGIFEWTDVGIGLNSLEHSKGLEFNHPFFIVKNLISGEMFYASFAWSGNWRIDFLRDSHGLDLSVAETVSAGAIRVIAPHEGVFSPEIHIAHTSSSLDQATQEFHKHLRHFVLPHRGQPGTMQMQYVMPADQGYYTPFTEDSTLKCVEVAKEIGAEVFILDAYWWDVTCDWVPSVTRFPDGLDRLISAVKRNGMKFGLYLEMEGGRGNIEQSAVYKEHPEWFFSNYHILDIGIPEAADYMENEIGDIIEKYQVDLFRLDYNPAFYGDGTHHEFDGFLENNHHRYYDNFTRIYTAIHARYPHVTLQQAAAGGARNNLGIAKLFHENYLTDGANIPREFLSYAGQTLMLPPEVFVPLHGADGAVESNLKPQNLDTILRLSYAMGTPHIFVAAVAPSVNEMMPGRLGRFKHYAELYRNVFRKHLPDANVYHHAPIHDFGGYRSSPWFCMEYTSPDSNTGWGVILRMFHAAGDQYYTLMPVVGGNHDPLYPEKEPPVKFAVESTYRFVPRGIDSALIYEITLDSKGSTFVIEGYRLMNEGIVVSLPAAGMSELVLYKSVGRSV